ncbi:MAG: NAD-dependent dehydratase, partial [Actinobacteria bacterium 13_2_20CM_2_72_6]
ASAGHDVLLLDSFHPAAHRSAPEPPGGLPLVVGDVRDAETVERAVRGADAVVHQAAMVGMGVDLADLPEYVGCNDLGTAVLLAAMARAEVGRLVLASSMVVYGEGAYTCPLQGPVRPAPRDLADLAAGRFEPRCPACAAILRPGLVDEAAALEPRSGYAATKVAQEHLAGVWARVTGGVAVALRYHNVYGPGMPRDTPYSGVAAIFRSALEHGRAPRVFEDGAQRRDFVHVRDVASANVRALDAALDAGTLRAYNVASGEPCTIRAMAEALSDAFGGPAPEITGAFRAGDVRHVVASPERARRELDFAAAVPFAAGIAEFATAPLRG